MPKVKSKDWEKRIRDFIKKIDYGGNWTPLGLKQHGDTLISIIRSHLSLSYSQGQKDKEKEIREWCKGQIRITLPMFNDIGRYTEQEIKQNLLDCEFNDALNLIINHLEGK